jgi:hypothetical protein
MIKRKSLIFIVVVFITSTVLAQGVVIDQVVTGRQIADANGTTVANPNKIAITSDGKYVFTDTSDTANERVYLADVSTTPPTITLLTDENALRDKVDAVNGDASRPAAVTIQALAVDEDGWIVIASDLFTGGNTETGLIFRLNPQSKEIRLLAGLDGPSTRTSVEGIQTIAVRGRTVYINLEDGFGSLDGDHIVTVSLDAPDGGRTPAQEFVSEATLQGLLGLTDPLTFRLVGFLPNGNLVLSDSGAGDPITESLIEINTTTGAVSILVEGSDIEADIGGVDIGPNGGAIDPNGTIYLTNAFGVGPTDDSVIVIRNAGGGKGDASMLALEAAIIASPSITDIRGNPLTGLFLVTNAAVSPATATFVFVEGNCDCLIRIRETQ